ncbi:hypothetical protein GIB67_010688 [Kingdonia uniflora]|uniref:Uncharacterized protein n=1 Tax=Kingdonia uniflora TaxID=39325 RepID=A0A7J7MP14_9MAGN|nr:hypothetical protein GIB67_010688 [Kingdonia uniflora]
MPSKNKRKRIQERRPTIHPRNKCSSKPPDFKLLASLYSNFEPFVFYSGNGYPNIDWTDFNATRELTRVLLHHDHGVNWWIPDGQLCPTVPNRSNYIHWIEDLLSSEVIAKSNASGDKVRGFDIGTGANCIYPLLGASLLGWNFVGSGVIQNVKNRADISSVGSFVHVSTDHQRLLGLLLLSLSDDPNNEELLSAPELKSGGGGRRDDEFLLIDDERDTVTPSSVANFSKGRRSRLPISALVEYSRASF